MPPPGHANRPAAASVGHEIVSPASVGFSPCWTPSTPPRCAAGAAAALAALRAHQHEIDELNVYPVPDGDTGTNLVLTLTSAAEALEGEVARLRRHAGDPAGPGDAPDGPRGAARRPGQLRRDRLADPARHGRRPRHRGRRCAAASWPRALRTASEAAYAAVARPVEGTVLSVVAAAAEAAGRIRSDDLAGGGPGRGARRRPRRWPAPRSSCRCWPAPGWSTPAGAACACCSTPWSRRSPATAPAPVAARRGGRCCRCARRDRRRPQFGVRGAVPARRRRRPRSTTLRDDPRRPGRLAGGRRHRRGRAADLERARPRQRHRRGDRGRRRGRPAVPDRGHPVRRPPARRGPRPPGRAEPAHAGGPRTGRAPAAPSWWPPATG